MKSPNWPCCGNPCRAVQDRTVQASVLGPTEQLRPDRQASTSAVDSTLSDRRSRGERAHSRRSARRPAWATCLAGARRRIIMGARCNRERGGSSRPVMPVKRALKANAGDQEMLKNSAPPILDARFGVAMVRRARSHLNRVGADQAGLHVARGKPRGRRAGQVGGEGGSSGQDFQLRTSSSQSNSI